MASFEDRYSPSYSAGPSQGGNQLTAGLYRKSHQMRNDIRISAEFPSQGTPYGAHEGSQSKAPAKDFIDRLDPDLQGQIEDRR